MVRQTAPLSEDQPRISHTESAVQFVLFRGTVQVFEGPRLHDVRTQNEGIWISLRGSVAPCTLRCAESRTKLGLALNVWLFPSALTT